MKCFGDKTKTFHCKVVLLDEQELIQEVQETTSGQDLLDTVYQHLNLIETAYFGLRFIDPSNQTHWLDPSKRLSKQLKGTSPYTLYFSVKFYAADPTKLVEEITRYQFFLQTKQDILQGRLPVSTELVSELGSFAVQSELGDYDPRRHSPGYVSEFRFATNQTVDLENKIADLHKKLVGYVPSKAELCYLEKVKWLDMYGVDLHSVLGEDSTEYFLGLTPSGIIVLRNKVKVGNYFWPRITKVYFRGRFFMLRVKDKNNSENTYGFETPSKSACKHLWQCCVEHHAFFRLTQAAGTSPQAIFSLGSKYRYSGRTEKEAVSDAKVNNRPQTEFARTPSRRYQRRIVEGANDTPRVDEADHKPETRTIVSLPGSVTPVSSHVYRSTSLTLAPRSDSPRSIRSAPHPSGLQHKGISAHFGSSTTRRVGRPGTRDESPGSVKSVSNGRAPESTDRIARRTSSVESQSSVDSRGCTRSCSRHRRSRCRSSDGESEASSKCSSKGHRRHHHKHHHHRHRNHSDDSSDQHKHRRRRHRHRSSERPEPQLVESSGQWAKVQSGQTPAKSNTATVRDLTSGYMPSGHEDTELDNSVHHHSSRRKHRKHRSRSRSPSEGKHKNYPEEIRRHIDFGLQNTEGLTEAQLKEIPYTKVETAKNVKIRYGSPKGKRHKSPKRSKSNSSDRKNQQNQPNDVKDVPNTLVQGTYNENYKNGSINGNERGTMERLKNGKIPNENEYRNDNDSLIMNGNIRPCPRTSQGLMGGLTTSRESSPRDERVASLRSSPQRDSSPLRNFQETGILQRTRRESPQSSLLCDYGPKSTMVNGQGRSYTPNGNNRSSYNNQSYTRDQTHHPINNINNYINTSENTHSQYQHHRNPHTGGVFLQPLHDSSHTQDEEEGEMSSGFVDSNSGGFMSPSPILIKNATLERGSHFTSVLKPQPSPQSSVTSGISIGSSSVSISNDSCLTRSSRSFQPSNNEYPSPSQSQDLSPPSSSPDPEITPYIDKHINPAPRSISRQNGEPFYMNARSSHCPVHANSQSNNNNSRTYHEQNHYANDGLTQHSTNILIQYHDGNSSGASSGYKTPTPTPRSSVISSIHSPDTSTHIVQSYGPAYANSHIVNSLKRNSHTTNLSRPSSRSSTNSQKTYTTRDNISTNKVTSGKEAISNYSSLPRKTMSKPFRRSTGSQTNLPSPDELEYDDETHSNFSIKDKIAFHEKQTLTTKPHDTLNNFLRAETSDSNSEIFKSRSALCSPLNGLEIREGSENVNSWQRETNQSSESHWKVYNWDTGRNEENWSNSLGRNNLTQDLYNGQRSGDGSQFARRGSAGSLDLILSPLIQSALEHQQR